MWGNPCSGGVNTTPLTQTGSGVKPPPREGHTHRGQCHTCPSPGEVSVPVTPLLSPLFSLTAWGALPNVRIIFLFAPVTFVTAPQSFSFLLIICIGPNFHFSFAGTCQQLSWSCVRTAGTLNCHHNCLYCRFIHVWGLFAFSSQVTCGKSKHFSKHFM